MSISQSTIGHNFIMACENGQLELAQYILEINPDIINIIQNKLFKNVCKKGHV